MKQNTVNQKPGLEFSKLVQNIITGTKSWSVKVTADLMSMTVDKLRSRIRLDDNRVPFSPEEIRSLIAAMPDVRIVDYFLEDSPFIAAKRYDPNVELEENIHQFTAKFSIEAAEVYKVVQESLLDRKIDHQEKILILKEIQDAERELASLKNLLDPTENK